MADVFREVDRICTLVWTSTDDPVLIWRALSDLVARWEVLPPQVHGGGAWFAARGPSRLWGGEVSMAEAVTSRLAESGATDLGVAVAPGRLLSWVFAHDVRDRPLVLDDRQAVAARERLPVTVLSRPGGPAGLTSDITERLVRLGLRSLGEVAAMASADLVGRFGESGRRAHGWASGLEPPVVGRVPSAEVAVHLDFVPPVTQLDAVLFAGRRLADQLDHTMRRRGEVATAVRIQIDTDHGERSERLWSHVDGLSAHALVDRVKWQVHDWSGGPVVLLRFAVVEVDGERTSQAGWWGGEAHGDERAARAVARVAGLLGDDATGQLVRRGGRDPVDRYQRRPVAVGQVPGSSSGDAEPWPGSLPAPSPARVWHRALPVDVCDVDGRTIMVGARGELSASPQQVIMADGTVREVVGWAGPWPLEERWWRTDDHRRQARLQIITGDGEAWLVHVQQQRWWLRATYS
jgi:protein ImuB